jgi:hypothetical protein
MPPFRVCVNALSFSTHEQPNALAHSFPPITVSKHPYAFVLKTQLMSEYISPPGTPRAAARDEPAVAR